ncbi:transmembrane protein 131 [Helicoverpa armigera]|uniref:transmembrane protein 131 n=1 Tax=Helicoverpa armigera TaxID=29058 RepID=UPI0030829438
MYRKIVWCYVFVLTLLDITLNTKLSAQGKSHGVTVHDSLIEGITFQEWGGPGAVAAGALQLSPPALHFGRAALAAAHALTVTLTNTANTTMHLASVAGTTPDFHASFFDSKTLPPQANTSFTVVYLGRREGPVSAHIYIHTSLGVHKYPVSAEGVASQWGVWPLLGVRVPLNASVEPLLTLHNPTDHTIQVSEVYSSGAWLGLELPGGGARAPRELWAVPARSSRPLVRLRLAPGAAAAPLTAYVRIKGNMTGGGLLVCVTARSVPPGEHLSPLQLRLRTRGSLDPPDVFDIEAGNSAGTPAPLAGGVWAPRCGPAPPAPPPPPADRAPTHNGQSDKGMANGNGAAADGVRVTLLRASLEPHQALARAAHLTFDYAALWGAAAAGGAGAAGAWCAGWLRLGRAALPYSVRLLPGTLRLDPPALHFVTAARAETLELRVHNDFPAPVLVTGAALSEGAELVELTSLTPLALAPGAGGVVARVRLRGGLAPAAQLSAHVSLRSNVTDYEVPLYVYSGQLQIEWDWPNSEDGELRLGLVGTSSTRRVAATVRNPAPAPLCITDVALDLPGASLALAPCGPLRAPPPGHACRCVAARGALGALLTVVAPARAGALRGALALRAEGAGGAVSRGAGAGGGAGPRGRAAAGAAARGALRVGAGAARAGLQHGAAHARHRRGAAAHRPCALL